MANRRWGNSPLGGDDSVLLTSTPTFSPVAGTYPNAQSVAISDSQYASVIYYTTDGSTPTYPISGTTQKYTSPIAVNANETIQALAISGSYQASAVGTAVYLIQAAVPTFSPNGGTFSSATNVVISSTTPSATIYYTQDGSTPTTGSPSGASPLTVSVAVSETLKAIATAPGFAQSAVGTSAAYTISAGTGFLPAGHWIAAKQAMIQVYPRPDSETNTWARHRWAYYDGTHSVQYQIPLGVIFGSFPYVYQLLSGPPGMSIGALTWNTAWVTDSSSSAFQKAQAAGYGYLQWTPTGAVSGATVSVLVTDQQMNTLTINFTVSTSSSTSQFIFVDAVNGNDSTGTGTISAPWQTFTHATTGNANRLLYMRSGTYTFTASGTDSGVRHYNLNTNSNPSAYIGFPGDTSPVVDMTAGCWASTSSGTDIFIQGLNPNGYDASSLNARFYWTWSTGLASSRETFDNNIWTNCGNSTGGSNNATGYFFDGAGAPEMQYQFVNNCSETNRTSGYGNSYAICSFYGTDSSLVQGCSLVQPGLTCDGFCYFKVGATNSCMRGNHLNVGTTGNVTHNCSTGQAGSGIPLASCEFCYNTLVNTNGGIFQTFGGPTFPASGPLWTYRNSVIGNHNLTSTMTSGGPYVFENNAGQGPNNLTGSAVTQSGNLIVASGLLDSNGNLTATYSSSVGTVGAQIA